MTVNAYDSIFAGLRQTAAAKAAAAAPKAREFSMATFTRDIATHFAASLERATSWSDASAQKVFGGSYIMAFNAQEAGFDVSTLWKHHPDLSDFWRKNDGQNYELALPKGITREQLLGAVRAELEKPIAEGGKFGLSIKSVTVNGAQPGFMVRLNPPPGGIPADLR